LKESEKKVTRAMEINHTELFALVKAALKSLAADKSAPHSQRMREIGAGGRRDARRPLGTAFVADWRTRSRALQVFIGNSARRRATKMRRSRLQPK